MIREIIQEIEIPKLTKDYYHKKIGEYYYYLILTNEFSNIFLIGFITKEGVNTRFWEMFVKNGKFLFENIVSKKEEIVGVCSSKQSVFDLFYISRYCTSKKRISIEPL